MRNKSVLLIAILLLLLLFFLLSFLSSGPQTQAGSQRLFADVDVSRIVHIQIQTGHDAVELVHEGGSWALASSANYRVDAAKVRSLLVYRVLELDLARAERISGRQAEELGLDDKGVTAGKTRLRFLDAVKNELFSLYLGDKSKTKRRHEGAFRAIPGQYIRRGNSTQIYLVPEMPHVPAKAADWLDADIANILPEQVEAVEEIRGSGAEGSRDFILIRAPQGRENEFVLFPAPVLGEVIDNAVAAQVMSGLTNLRLFDVFSRDDSRLSSVQFDRRTVYALSSGLVYTVSSVDSQGKVLLRVEVSFDSSRAEILRKSAGVNQASNEARQDAALPKEDIAGPASAKLSGELREGDEARRLTEHFATWVYAVEPHLGSKFRRSRSELVRQIMGQ